MIWTFQRDQQKLRLEVRSLGTSGEWEMVLHHPDGSLVAEQFGRRDLLQTYLVTVQDTLKNLHWSPVGAEDDSEKAQGLRLVQTQSGGRTYSAHGAIASDLRDIAASQPPPPDPDPEAFDLSDAASDIPREWSGGALYALESAARCPHCREPLNSVRVLRLKRLQVSFTSTLPRGGNAIVCPQCERIISAELGGLI